MPELDLAQHGDATVTVKINGIDKVVSVKEAMSGYMRDADYRVKTTKVAEDRKAVEADQQTLSQFQQFKQQLQANPQQTLKALAASAGVEYSPSSSPGEEEDDNMSKDTPIEDSPVVQQLMEQNRQLMEKMENFTRDSADEKIISQIRGQFGDEVDVDAVAAYADQNGITGPNRLDIAFKAMNFQDVQDKVTTFETEKNNQQSTKDVFGSLAGLIDAPSGTPNLEQSGDDGKAQTNLSFEDMFREEAQKAFE